MSTNGIAKIARNATAVATAAGSNGGATAYTIAISGRTPSSGRIVLRKRVASSLALGTTSGGCVGNFICMGPNIALAVRTKAIVGNVSISSNRGTTSLVVRPNTGVVTRNAISGPVIFASSGRPNGHTAKS